MDNLSSVPNRRQASKKLKKDINKSGILVFQNISIYLFSLRDLCYLFESFISHILHLQRWL